MEPAAYCFHKTFEPAGPTVFTMDRHYLLYAYAGTLQLEANGRRWLLPPARAAFIAAGEPITISILTKVTSASVLFSPTVFLAPKTPLVVFDMSSLARELIAECRPWVSQNEPLSPYAAQIFSTLATVVENLVKTPSACSLPVPKSIGLVKALEMTESQYDNDPKFTDIALATGQSERALARRFSAEMGMTWREVLRRIRLMKAVELLAGSDEPVTTIAFNVGYRSLSAFNAAFQDLIGKTPSQYRATFKQR